MKSIFFRLMLSFLAVIILVIVVISIFFSQLLKDYFVDQRETELENKGSQIVTLSRDFLNGNIDEDTFSYLISSIDDVVDSRTLIIDRFGFVINPPFNHDDYGITDPSKGMKFDVSDIAQIFNGYTVTKSGYSVFYKEPMITVGVPIYSGSKKSSIIGAVIMSSPVTGVTEALNKAYIMLVLACMGALAFSLFSAYFLSRTLSKPIHVISKAALEIAEGNYLKRVNIRRRDEIGNLATTFNYLTGKLNDTILDLNNEKRKLSDILYSMEEGLIAVDSRLNIIHINPAARHFLSMEQTSSALTDKSYGKDIMTNAMDVLKAGSTKSYNHSVTDKIHLNILISPLKYQNGHIYGAIILLQDVSESVRLEKMRRDFVANVSHELRTPLTSIRGFIEPLIDGTVDDDTTRTKYHEIIRDETLRLERLINDLLDLSRLQSGKTTLDMQRIDIIELISNVSAKFKPIFDSREIDFMFDKPDGFIFILADGDKVEQLMIIFIDNAIKYTPPGGSIRISLAQHEELVGISIKDTGVGIPEEDIPYIWDRFYKVDKSRTGKSSGTGLGLSIAKNIIELHGQRVTVESKVGEGTAFEFTMKKYVE